MSGRGFESDHAPIDFYIKNGEGEYQATSMS